MERDLPTSKLVAKAGSRESLGITLMVTASLLVPSVDGVAKFLSAGMSPLYLAFCRYLVAACFVLPFAVSTGKMQIRSSLKLNVVRTLLIVGSMCSFFVAIKQIPLATAFGGYFLGPIIAAVCAARLLGERVSVVRILSAAIGFLGAILIVQPTADFEIGSVFAVTSGVLFGAYLLITRLAASSTPPPDSISFPMRIRLRIAAALRGYQLVLANER
jgi:drug/metabolite transporter (DMT)-like permease